MDGSGIKREMKGKGGVAALAPLLTSQRAKPLECAWRACSLAVQNGLSGTRSQRKRARKEAEVRGEAVPPVLAASGGGEVRGRWTARPAVPVRLPWLRPVGPPALPRAKWRRTSPKKDVGRTAAASAEGRVPRAEPRAHGSGRAHAWADHIRHTTDWSVDERDRVPRASERRAMRAATTRVSHARILNKKTERSRRHRAPGPGRGGCRGAVRTPRTPEMELERI